MADENMLILNFRICRVWRDSFPTKITTSSLTIQVVNRQPVQPGAMLPELQLDIGPENFSLFKRTNLKR